MTDNIKETIQANAINLETLLSHKFHIDSFQREYNWERKHIATLINDLTSAFLMTYRKSCLYILV